MDDQLTSELPGAATSISPTADGGAAAGSGGGAGAGPTAGSASSNAEWPTRWPTPSRTSSGAFHDKVIRPLIIVARGLVFGIVIGPMGLLVAILMAIALVRLLTVYAFSGRVWASDALVGAVLVALGAFAWSSVYVPGTQPERAEL